MRMTFDQSVPVHEQISRILKCHTGRKHQHRKGPGKAQRDPYLAAAKHRRQARWLSKARAYWSGQSEEHP